MASTYKFKTKPLQTVHSISPAAFMSDFFNQRTPVVIRGEMADWKAMSLWSFDYLKSACPSRMLNIYDHSAAKSESPDENLVPGHTHFFDMDFSEFVSQ